MKAHDKLDELMLQYEKYGQIINEPRPLSSPCKIDLHRSDFGHYHLDVFLSHDRNIKMIEENLSLPIRSAVSRTDFACFDNMYLVFSVIDSHAKITQEHYFRLTEAMQLCELAESAYTGSITAKLLYHRRQHRKLNSRIDELCATYENLPIHLGINLSFHPIDPPTPEELMAIEEIKRLEDELEKLTSESRKNSYAEEIIFTSISLSGAVVPSPSVYQDSLACSSCVVGYKPNIDFDKPAWKFVICNSFMPIEKTKDSMYDARKPLEMAKLHNHGLLLTIKNFYFIMKKVDAILLRWLTGQL